MKKISIIIPVYNRLKEFEQCLASIQKQTFQDFEVVVVNDGSTDFTEQELDTRINTYHFSDMQVHHQQNQGAPVARNNGFKKSSADLVIFCDADVVMQPEMLEKMLMTLDTHPEASYVYSSFKFGWKTFTLWEFDADRLREMPYIHTTSLIRREHFPQFDPTLKKFQDWDVWLTMLEQGHTGLWVPEVLFTVKGGGTMSAWLPSFLSTRNAEYQKSIDIIQAKHS